MKTIKTMHYLPFACLLVTTINTPQLYAGWYDKQPEKNINPGYGSFPPSNIDEVLNGNSGKQTSIGYGSFPHADIERKLNRSIELNQHESEPEQQKNSAPAANEYTYQSVPLPEPYVTMPNYGYYDNDRAGESDSVMPWSYNGPDFQVPWSNGDSGFSPWGKRGWTGNRNPFSNSGLNDWF